MLHRHDEYVTYQYALISFATKSRVEDLARAMEMLQQDIKEIREGRSTPSSPLPVCRDPSIIRDLV